MQKKIFSLLFLICATCLIVNAQNIISPSSGKIKALGRTEMVDSNRLKFDFPGVRFIMQFSGSKSIAVKFKSSSKSYFQAIIDGKVIVDTLGKPILFGSISDTTCVLATGLCKSKHEIVFFKRTENLDNIPSEFMGFIVDDGAKVEPAPKPKARKLEFIGNSITCGFGTEACDKADKFTPETENNYLSYANVISRAFDADVNVVSHSGRGVVRNYGDKYKVSTQYPTVPKLYVRSIDADSVKHWDFNQFKPDAVIINLGTNDFSTFPYPDKPVFIDGYLKLIATIRGHYGQETPIFCVVGPMIDEPCYSYVKEMVEMQRKANKDSKTYFIGIPTALMNPSLDFGASYHPGGDGQKKMAEIVAPVISTVLGWSYDSTEMLDIKGGQSYYCR